MRYSINRSKYQGENIGFKSELIDSKLINPKKIINQIVYISELQKVLILSDGILSSLNFHDLEPATSNNNLFFRIKNVTLFCFSEKYKDQRGQAKDNLEASINFIEKISHIYLKGIAIFEFDYKILQKEL